MTLSPEQMQLIDNAVTEICYGRLCNKCPLNSNKTSSWQNVSCHGVSSERYSEPALTMISEYSQTRMQTTCRIILGEIENE